MGNLPCVLTDFVVSLKRTKGREKKTKSRSESPDRRETIGAMPGKAGLRRLDFAMEAEEPAEIGGSIRVTGAKKKQNQNGREKRRKPWFQSCLS